MTRNSILTTAVILLILIGVGSIIFHYERKLQDSALSLDAATGMVTILRNQYNESVAERQSFEGDRDALKGEVARWEREGDSLRTKIGKQTQQVALLKSELNFKAKGRTEIVRDTVQLPGETISVNESYQIDTVNRFISLNAKVNASDYTLDLNIKELDIEFATTTNRRGLFGPEYTTVTAISRNPYVENKDLKSVTIQKKKPIIGKAAIFVAGIIAGLII